MPQVGNIYVPDNLTLGTTTGGSASSAAPPSLGAVASGAVQQAYGQVRYGLPYALEKALSTTTPQDDAFYQEGLKRTSEAARAAAPSSLGDLTSGKVGFGRFLASNVVASVPALGAMVAGGVAGTALGGVVGGVAGTIAAGTPQFVGQGVQHSIDATGGLTQEQAGRALVTAPVESAINAFAERFLPGAGHIVGDLAATQTGGFISRVAQSALKSAGAQSVAAAATNIGDRYTAGQDLTGPGAAAEYANAAATAFVVGGVLGAGGGIRRMDAHTKPAADVTIDDTNAAVDAITNPQPTAPAAPQLQLTDQRAPAAPISVGADGVAITPEQAGAFVDPAALSRTPVGTEAPTGLDLANQNYALGQNRLDAVNLVRDITSRTPVDPSIPDILRATPPAGDPAADLQKRLNSTTSSIALDAVANPSDAVNPVQPRMFGSEPVADLHKALATKDASPEVKAEATREIAQRTAEASGDAPLTTDDFATRLADVKEGLRGSFVTKLEAKTPEELVTKVYDQVLVNQDTSANVTKLAQRLGLLDDKLEPTAKADAIEKQRTDQAQADAAPAPGTPVGIAPVDGTPAAPTDATGAAPAAPAAADAAPETVQLTPHAVDPAFAAQFDTLKADAGISRTSAALKDAGLDQTPANLADAQTKVFSALATDKSNAAVSQTEKLAQKMGLISDNDARDVTPLGRQVYLSTPEGRTEIEQAKAAQGFTGDKSAAFEQGIQSQLTGKPVGEFSSFEDLAAHEAGKIYAKDVVENGPKALAQTDAIRARQEARGTVRDAVRDDVKSDPLSPGQINQRALNNLLDKADLRTASDSDVAGLRRMVRDGADPETVGRALQQVQGGKTLFKQPEPVIHALPDAPTRGQPIFKEMNVPEGRGMNKTQSRVENEAAVRTYDQRNAIRQAVVDKEISAARADKLNDLLDAGKVDQVERLTADLGSIKRASGAADFQGKTLLGSADPQLEQFIEGKDFKGTLDHLATHGPSPYYRDVLSKVRDLAAEVTKAGGHSFDIQITKPGDAAPIEFANPDVRAYAQLSQNPAKATVYLKSAEFGPESGMNYQVAGHEAIHAVTMQAMDYAHASDPTGKTKLGKAVKDLDELSQNVIAHIEGRIADGASDLTQFERAYGRGDHNAFDDPHEILAWGLTNPEMQNYLQSIAYKPRESVFSRMVSLVRDMLGISGKYDTALTELMRVSEQVLGTKARELAPAYVRDNPNGFQTTTLAASEKPGGFGAAVRKVADSNEVTKTVADTVTRAAEKIDVPGLQGKARRAGLYIISQNQMDRQFAGRVPSLTERSDAKRAHDAIRGRFASMGDQAYQRFSALETASKDRAETLGKLMAAVTEFQLDPDRAYADHSHLDPADAPRLQPLHAELVKMKDILRRGDGEGYKTYQEFRQRNEAMNYAHLATDLHDLVAMDPELSLGVAGAAVNPMDTFMMQGDLATPEAIRDHWQKALTEQISAAQQFVNLKRGEASTGTASDIRGMNQHLSPIEAKISSTYEALKGMARAPYFHLGRFGDNFGSATIRKLESGVVDPKAQEHVAEALDAAGFKNMQISADSTNPKIAGRFESIQQTNDFRALMETLHQQGWLDGEKHDIQAGPRDMQSNLGVVGAQPEFLNRQIQAIETDPRYQPAEGMDSTAVKDLEARKQETIQIVRDAWLEQQPDNGIAKVLTARKTVPGYDPDMVRNFAHRWNVGSTSIANRSTSAKMSNAMKNMRTQLEESRHSGSTTDPNMVSDVLREVTMREAQNPINPTAGSFTKLRAISHSYYLGMSPAYAAIQLMQVGTNGLPELAKVNGYGKSFHAMRRALPAALAVMRASTAEASKGGAAHYADVALTEAALQRAGLTKPQTDFLRRMIATGSLDIGQSANALHQIAESGTTSKADVAMKYASAMGLHAETLSRLVVALAAHELHGSSDTVAKAAYAQNVLSNSMFDYQNWNTARALGKQGFAGPVTPLLTQFMTYSSQMTEKLYSETASALGKARDGETPAQTAQRAKESRAFLAGHLTAITALAGTLGLPFASVFATATEKLVNGFNGSNDEPYDATASWRNFLAGVLGKDVAEVVSRGAPRALGFDISTRVGESDLLPFSSFLGDKRGWKEAVQASFGRATGAGPDMLLNVADAGSKFANGDVLGGMKEMLPVAFKGPTEAYRMATEGYIDTKGNKLPLTPGAADILYQLLGFTPAQKAEYNEARGDQQTRRLQLTSTAGALRGQIVKAITSGDTAGAQALIGKAQEFDTANPTFAVIPQLQGAVERQAQNRATAQALGTPLGVGVSDVAGRHLTGYANFGQ